MTHAQKVITAQDTADGSTVYLTSCDAWSAEIEVAELLSYDDFDWRLAFANRLKEVKSPALIPAREGMNGLPELIAA